MVVAANVSASVGSQAESITLTLKACIPQSLGPNVCHLCLSDLAIGQGKLCQDCRQTFIAALQMLHYQRLQHATRCAVRME
jgi:hypothetical protein